MTNQKELIYEVKMQEDGTYLAVANYKGSYKNKPISATIPIDARTYKELKQRVKDITLDFLSDGFGEKIGLYNPKIRLHLQEKLIDYGNKESILIAGNPEGAGYRAISNSKLNLDIYNEDLEILRGELLKRVKESASDRNVEFRLEEVLD
ncbi:MAG: hypothetical protein KJ767_02930 [Nanoarchaeota archaeon]|nr:hypothetical protein [Nanoarchaeota archaeon]